MAIKRVSGELAKRLKGRTDWQRVMAMTDREIKGPGGFGEVLNGFFNQGDLITLNAVLGTATFGNVAHHKEMLWHSIQRMMSTPMWHREALRPEHFSGPLMFHFPKTLFARAQRMLRR
jgi:hypothetical protein